MTDAEVPSDATGPTLGAWLRTARTAAGLSQGEVAARTCITPRWVSALEDDRVEELPAPVYARGFIRAYCSVIGVSPEVALLRYEGLRPPAPARPPAHAVVSRSVPDQDRPDRRRWRAGLALTVVLLAMAGGGAYAWVRAARLSEPRAPAASREASPARGPATTAARVLVVHADEATWLRVRTADGASSEATLEAGGSREWRSTSWFIVTVGNAGGVRVLLDGRSLPALGERGQVVRDLVIPSERGS